MFRMLARMLLSAIFVASSGNAIQNAEHMTGPAEKLGIPEPVTAVKTHGVINLIGGLLMALGIKPRTAAYALAGNLIVTTAGAHAFWDDTDEAEKMSNQIHFFKNVSLLGGLLAVIVMERAAASVDD